VTPTQLRIVVALSLLCTLVVLGAGLRDDGGGGADAASALVGQRRPVTIAAPALGGAAEASGEAGSGGEGEAVAGSPAPARTVPASAGTGGDGGGMSGGEGSGEGAGSGASGGEGAGGSGGTGSGGSGGSGPGTGATTAAPQPTRIKHVFLIALAGHGFDTAFGAAAAARYLSGTLRPQGTLLSGYRTLGAAGLPDELAMIGGQPPNAATRADCATYKEFPSGTSPSSGGVVAGSGCVYPNTVTTIADQLTASRRTWRAYVEDLDSGPAPAAGGTGSPRTTCRHPQSNAADPTLRARPGDGYATRLNPFVYYHSLLDLGDCDANDGALSRLEADLRSVRTTPSLSFIAPNLCDDGAESPCVDGTPGGLPAADAFLARWTPRILASPAYRADGLLIVAFAGDVAPPAGAGSQSTPADAPVREGALLVSRFARAGTTAASVYDPYSLLRSLEDVFGLRPLAKAARAASFAPTVLSGAYATPPSDG